MAEQLLYRTQIAAARQKMGGEGVPQRMRRRRIGQAQRAAQPRHRQLHNARQQRTAARADEQRAVRRQVERAERNIVGDQFGDLRQHRHHARLVAFAGDSDGVAGLGAGSLLPFE